jgi:hypothetical protein
MESNTDKVVEIFYNGELVKTYKMPVTTPFILSEKELIDLLYEIYKVIMSNIVNLSEIYRLKKEKEK